MNEFHFFVDFIHEKNMVLVSYSFCHNINQFISANQKISEMRLRPASPNHNERVLIDHVETTYDSTTREYTVTLYPLYCGHDFDLFQLLNNKQVEKLP